MAVYLGGKPPKTPASRRELAAFQRNLPPDVWHRQDPPLVRCGIAGSGEDMVVLAWTAAALAVERDAGVAMLRRFGVKPGMRAVHTLPGALFTPGSLLLGDVLEALGVLDVPLGPIRKESDSALLWSTVRSLNADVLVTEAASGLRILREQPPADVLAKLRHWIWMSEDPTFTIPPLPPLASGTRCALWLTAPEAECFFAYRCPESSVHLHHPERVRIPSPEERRSLRAEGLIVAADSANQGIEILVPWPVRNLRHCACGQGGALELGSA